jgi:hypothetical protein
MSAMNQEISASIYSLQALGTRSLKRSYHSTKAGTLISRYGRGYVPNILISDESPSILYWQLDLTL